MTTTEKGNYGVFLGGGYVRVQATTAKEAFLEAKKTLIHGPFQNAEQHEQAAAATKLTGKVYCPNGDRVIFDERGFYTPREMFRQLYAHSVFASIGSLADELPQIF